MRIAIMGSGGVGGYYGGLLARIGHQVVFVARGAHLAALRRAGLRIVSVHGDFSLPVQATDDPASLDPVDWVIVSVKTPDTEPAAAAIRPLIGPETIVTSLQNGVDAAERLGAVVGHGHVVGGVTYISSALEAPGVIRQVSQFRRVILGELDGRLTPRVERLVQALRAAGVSAEQTTDIRQAIWTKFVFIAGISGLGSLTRQPVGAYRDVPESRAMLVALMSEVEAVGRAAGVALDPDVVPGAMALVDAAAPSIRASMQRDVEVGRRSELESMIGVIGRLGRTHQVPTPVADLVYAALLPGERQAPPG